jgi:hypothetical protein
MLKLVALRIGARLVLDWTSWAAIALAVVLANSSVEHLRPDAALLRHYQDAAGIAALAYTIGILQLAAAAAVIWRRTRYGACAALIAMLIISIGNQIIDGRAGDGLIGPLSMLVVAAAIARTERRRNAQASGIAA